MQLDKATASYEHCDFQIVPFDSLRLSWSPHLGPHWYGVHAVISAGLSIVEMAHVSGSRAVWFFDGAGRQSDGSEFWSTDHHQALRNAFYSAVSTMIDVIFFKHEKPQSEIFDSFMKLSPRIREAIAIRLQSDILLQPYCYSIDVSEDIPILWSDRSILKQSLSENLQERFIVASQSGAFTWLSPVDGQGCSTLPGRPY